jgi:hypothetical protein
MQRLIRKIEVVPGSESTERPTYQRINPSYSDYSYHDPKLRARFRPRAESSEGPTYQRIKFACAAAAALGCG